MALILRLGFFLVSSQFLAILSLDLHKILRIEKRVRTKQPCFDVSKTYIPPPCLKYDLKYMFFRRLELSRGESLQHLTYEISHFSKGFLVLAYEISDFLYCSDFQGFLRSDLPIGSFNL